MNRQNWAVVPVKSFRASKYRMSDVLNNSQRKELSEAMLFDVLSALNSTPGLAGVLVVTADPGAIEMSYTFGFDILKETEQSGPTAAIQNAIRALKDKGCTGMLAVMGDLPLISSKDIELLMAAHNSERAVTLVPSHDRLGTNAVFCSPPDVIELTFNGQGLADHVARSQQAGVETHLLDLGGIALDLDQPEDLATLLATGTNCRTREFLLTHLGSGENSEPSVHRKAG